MSRRAVVVALAGALGALPCAAQRAPGAAARPPALREAWARLLQAADARLERDTGAIDAALDAGDVALRRVALRAIGQVRVAARYDVLRRALAEADTGAAAEAAFALGLARDSLACTPLRTALARGGAVGVEAAWALGELGAGCARVEALLADAPDAATRVRLLEVAGRARGVPVAPLVALARDGTPAVRVAALYALARARRADGIDAAVANLRDTTDAVAEQVARLLARPLVPDSLGDLAAGTLLARATRHPAPHVRIAAVRALATWGERSADVLLGALGAYGAPRRDVDANVRVAVAQALDTLVLGRDAARWRLAWDADTTFMVRRSLVAGALRAGVALPGVAAWRTDADWRRRAAVAEGTGAAPDSIHVALALPALQDGDGRVRAAAVGAIASRADTAAAQRTLLARLAREEADPYARAAALGALGARATHADLPLALDAYRRAATDRDADARLAALRLLAAAWRRDSANVDAPTRTAIATLPLPDDLLLRAAVRDVAPLAAWREAPHPVRPLAHYRAIVARHGVPARAGREPVMTIATARGTVRIALHCADVPLTCAVFDSLAAARYWDGARFHRVVPAFVAQDGDPRGDGNGGPGFAVRDELTRRRYVRGAVGMALSGPDTGGSQYFLTLAPQPHLDGRYTVIGTVVGGHAAMDALVQGDSIRAIRIAR